MNKLRFVSIAALFAVAAFVVSPSQGAAPPPTVPEIATTVRAAVTTTTTLAEIPSDIPPDARCPDAWSLAARIGFPSHLLPTLDRVVYRESRCEPTQLNAKDPNGGSIGLTQVNRFWCLPSRYYADGYLQSVGVLVACEELYDAETNLRAALALVEYSVSVGLDEFAQWAWLAESSEND